MQKNCTYKYKRRLKHQRNYGTEHCSDTIMSSTLEGTQESSTTISCAPECEGDQQPLQLRSQICRETSCDESDGDFTSKQAVFGDPSTCDTVKVDTLFQLQASSVSEREPIRLVTAIPETTSPGGEIIATAEIEEMMLSLVGRPVGRCTEASVAAKSDSEAEKGKILTRYLKYASLLTSSFRVVDILPTRDAFLPCSDNDDVEIIETQFDVTMSSDNSVAMSIDEFKSRELHDLESHRKLVQSAWIIKTVADLREAGFDCGDGGNIELAKGIVLHGRQPKSNAIPCYCAPLDEIYRKYKYTDVKNYQCLLISAPMCDEEEKQRNEEMENFMRNTFPLTNDELGSVFKKVVTTSIEGIKEAIKEFFQASQGVRGKNALHALIVFFGHGHEDGRFALSSPDCGMPLDTINRFVKAEWKRAIRCKPEELSAKVEIVFSQCYGHLYKPEIECCRFRVIALARKHFELTLSDKDDDGQYYNVKLKATAIELLAPQYKMLTEMRTQHIDEESVGEAADGKSSQPDSEIQLNQNNVEAASETPSNS